MIQCTNAPQTTLFTRELQKSAPTEVPRFIIVGFQTNKSGSQRQNPAIFNNAGVKNIYATLDSTKYPVGDYDISFPRQQFSRAYSDAVIFRSKFFNMDELVSNPNISPSDYKDLYPLFLFDVSKQSEKLKNSNINIQIKVYFENNVNAGTEAYAVIISDRLINFNSD